MFFSKILRHKKLNKWIISIFKRFFYLRLFLKRIKYKNSKKYVYIRSQSNRNSWVSHANLYKGFSHSKIRCNALALFFTPIWCITGDANMIDNSLFERGMVSLFHLFSNISDFIKDMHLNIYELYTKKYIFNLTLCIAFISFECGCVNEV